jgi:hypothetical protein
MWVSLPFSFVAPDVVSLPEPVVEMGERAVEPHPS